jgi:hypothetical protein
MACVKGGEMFVAICWHTSHLLVPLLLNHCSMQDRWALASSPRQKHPNSISCSSVCCWHILYPDYKPPLRSFIHIWFVIPSSIYNQDNYDMKSKKDDIHSALLCTFNVHYGEESAGAPADLQHSVILSVLKVLIVRFGPPTPPV